MPPAARGPATHVVAVAVDPFIAQVWWEVSPADLSRAGEASPVLRFSDVTGGPPLGHFDVEIDLPAASRSVPLLSPRRSYRVELGFSPGRGQFVSLAGSEVIQTPPDAASTNEDYRSLRIAELEEPAPVPLPRAATEAAEAPVPAAAVEQPVRDVAPQPQPEPAQPWTEPVPGAGPVPATGPPVGAGAEDPVDAAQIIRARLAELYRLQAWPYPLRPQGLPAEVWEALGSGAAPDLTALSEWLYLPGISS